MKTFTLSLVAALGLAGAALADPLEGVWQTEPNDEGYAHVRISACGAALCGKIIREFSTDGTPGDGGYSGTEIVHDMVPGGDGAYAGHVTDPTKDRRYKGKLQLSGDNLQMAGCVAGGLICSKQTWKRVE